MKTKKTLVNVLRTITAIVLLLTISFSVIGCGKSKSTSGGNTGNQGNEENKSTAAPAPLITNNEGKARSKVTGLWVDEATANNNPVAVMFENTSSGAPQSSIAQADILFESYVEGGITRLCGVFENKTDLTKIGPVRSCRTYYLFFAKEFQATYVHYGFSDYAKEYLEKEEMHSLDGMVYCGFYRSNDRVAPYNAYTSWQGIMDSVEAKNYPTTYTTDYVQPFKFNEDDSKDIELTKDQQPCYTFYPGYSYNKPWFEYDEATGEYLRFQLGAAHVDKETGEQLRFKNIVCKFVMGEDYPNGTPNYETEGKGVGIIITNGKAVTVNWEKKTATGSTHYYYLDGTEVVLNQGKTMICQMEAGQEFQILDK